MNKYFYTPAVLFVAVFLGVLLYLSHESVCYNATYIAYKLDEADTKIFNSMMQCKPNCDLTTYEELWAVREKIYTAWQKEVQACLQ